MENTSGTFEIAKQLNATVTSVISEEKLQGFERAYLLADATGKLKALLTPQYMKPIMDLQGNRLGFKTDKDNGQGGAKGPGYSEEVVKNCIIEAVLTGVQPVGNQFNIIAGNCYITKEGFGHLLANIAGLSYTLVPALPRIKDTSAAIVMTIEWSIDGKNFKKEIDFPIKVNQYMGADAVIGKATRKARAWLYNTITGSEIADGDVMDVEAKVVASTLNDQPVVLEDLQLLFDLKREFLSVDELKNANRILENKELNSYSKLFKLLQSK